MKDKPRKRSFLTSNRKNRSPRDTGTYSNVVLAFLDILGFGDIIESKCIDNPNFLLDIFSENDASSQIYIFDRVKRRIISDSIILWTEDFKDGLKSMLTTIVVLQNQMLLRGVLVRGAIVCGNHYSERPVDFDNSTESESFDEYIISPALVRAARLEREIKVPEIVLDNDSKFQQIFSEVISTPYVPPLISRVTTPAGVFNAIQGFFDSYEFHSISFDFGRNTDRPDLLRSMAEPWKDDALEKLKLIRSHIQTNLREGKAKEKWEYIKSKFNDFVEICRTTSGYTEAPID